MLPMGYVDVAGVGYVLPDGRELFADVSFRVGEGAKVALVGPNGAGKTTLLRMVAGDLPVPTGAIARAGGLGVMRQFIGMIGHLGTAEAKTGEQASLAMTGATADRTLAEFALSLAPPVLAAAGTRVVAAEHAMHAAPHSEKAQMAYANALHAWG